MKKLPDEKDPRKDLSNRPAIEKIQELAKSARVCLFGTHTKSGPLSVRPMAVQTVDDQGNLWFLSGKSSEKNHDIARDPTVQLLFANVGDSEYLDVRGTATISEDRALIKEHWTPFAKAWFHEGVDDPEATVIKVSVESGYYWDTLHGKTYAKLSIAVGAITGKTLDDSVEGTVKLQTRRAAPASSRKRAAH